MAMAVGVVLLAAMAVGLVIDGIGLLGLLLTVLAVIGGVLGFFATYPRLKVPDLATINRGDVRTMVGRTQLWLEAQAPPSPPRRCARWTRSARSSTGWACNWKGSTPASPPWPKCAAWWANTCPAWSKPGGASPRTCARNCSAVAATPRSATGRWHGQISGEIDQITRQLAAGDIDALAIRGRYLDYRYGDALEGAPEMAPVEKKMRIALPHSLSKDEVRTRLQAAWAMHRARRAN
jgi:hypothetical protein